MKTFTVTQWKALNTYLRRSAEPLDTVIQIILETGCRVSEATRLGGQHLTGEGIFIPAIKGSENRTVPLSPDLMRKLRNIIHEEAFIEAGTKSKSAASRRAIIDRRLRWLCQRLDIPETGAHTLRHTLCSQLYKKTKDVAMLRAWIGHKDIKSTMCYVHLDNQDTASDIVRELLA